VTRRAALQELIVTAKQRRTRQPVVILASDDWGQSALPNRDAFERAVTTLGIGAHPFDLQGLETPQDIDDLAELLYRHRDSRCRSAVLSSYFILGNVEPRASLEARRPVVMPIDKGWPGSSDDDARWASYREAIRNGLMAPGLHGFVHCSLRQLGRALAEGTERGAALEELWRLDIPYLPSVTPWAAFAYENAWNTSEPVSETVEVQRELIEAGSLAFRRVFGEGRGTCAPGYRHYTTTVELLRAHGFDSVQSGVQPGGWGPIALRSGGWSVPRNVSFEVAIRPSDTVEAAFARIARLVDRGFPAVVSIHSINFQSSIRDHKTVAMNALDELLTSVERRYGTLVYASSDELAALLRPVPGPGREIPWRAVADRARALFGHPPEHELWA
jgi:hypothetical protein